MFVVRLQFKKNLEAIAPYANDHIAFLARYYAAQKFIVSGGRKADTDGRIIGGVILAHQLTRPELERILQEDPFHQHQLADYDITEFEPMYYAEAFRSFIDQPHQKAG